MSWTLALTSGVDWSTAPFAPASTVNSSRLAHGSQVEPSIVGNGEPSDLVVASRVTRWASSASRLIRVMYPVRPVSWPWNRKCVP